MSTKVLVFEHDAAFASELRHELGRLGCLVTIVDDGNAGLAQATADRPDLILLSIELPRMNGFSVCNKLKKDSQLKEVPLIIMSSESSDETFEQHKKLRTRAEDYVHKPIAFGELLEHVRAFLPSLGEGGDSGDAIDEEIVVDDFEEENELTQVGHVPPGFQELGAARRQNSAPPQPLVAAADLDAFADAAFDNLLGGTGGQGTPPASGQTRASSPSGPRLSPTSSRPSSPFHHAVDGEGERRSHGDDAGRPDIQRLERELAAAHAEVARQATIASRLQEAEEINARLARDLAEARAEARASDGRRSSVPPASGETVGAEQRISQLEEETKRLQRELEQARSSRTSTAPRPSGVSTREFLELREALNKKDKEILNLKDQLNAQEKGVLDLKDKLFSLERINVELDEKNVDLAKTLSDTQASLGAARADKEQATKRGDDYARRFERARGEADLNQKELVAERERRAADSASHARAVEQLEAASALEMQELRESHAREKDEALSMLRGELESSHAATVSALEAAREAALQQLRAEHESASESASQAHAHELADAHRASMEARDAAVSSKEAEVRAELEAKLAARVAELQSERDAALAASESAADARIAETVRDRDTVVAAAEARRVQEVEEAANVLAETRRSYEERIVEIGRARDVALGDAEARRVLELEEAEQVLASTRRSYDQRVATLESERDTLRAELQARVAELEASLARTKEDLEATIVRAAEGLEAERRARADSDERASTRISELTAEVSSRERVIAELQADLAATRSRLEEESEKARRSHEKWEKDRGSLERAKDAMAEALTLIEEAESRVA